MTTSAGSSRTTTRRRAGVAVAALLGMLVGLLGLGQAAHAEPTGLRITDGRLIESTGNDLVLRGVNHAHTWYQSETGSFADIKALGANSVRVVLASGQRWTQNSAADVTNVINLCKQNKLICVLEVHDTTGYGEQSGAATLDQAANYWISIKSALEGQEDYVILNIGNEPFGNTSTSGWTSATTGAIAKLRNAGFDHTIMVDAPNWGQDWSGTMRSNAQAVFNSDPDRNTIFSIHMYGVYDTAAEVRDYLGAFVNAELPIVVGEFGHDHSDGNPDEDAILATTQQLGLGYLGWSWSGNGGGVEYLDMVTGFNADQLTPWGQRLFNGPNGIAQTSQEAEIYGGGGNPDDEQAPTAPGTPTASAVTASSVHLAWAASSDNVGVTGYDVVRVSGGSESPAGSSATNSATVSGLSANTQYTFAVYAKDAAGNRSARSATVSVTTADGGTSADCAVDYGVVGEWGNGFQGEIVIHNSGTSAISNWTLGFSFANGQVINQMWGGTPSQSGAAVTVTPASYTATIPAGGSVSMGFIATKSAANTAPSAFTLSGGACSVL